MRFHLSDEQEAMQEAVASAAHAACPPSRRRLLLDAETDFDQATWDAVMKLGVAGMLVPDAFGGGALDLIDAAVVMEALGAAAAPGPLMAQVLAGYALSLSSDVGLKKRWLPEIAAGQVKATIAFGGGWLPDTWDAREQDDSLDAEVRFVVGADVADLYIVGVQGGGLVLVEKGSKARISAQSSIDPTRRLGRLSVSGASCARIGGVREGGMVMDAWLVMLAADALGGAGYCLSIAKQYALGRVQFGVPIGQFQAVKHQLADMAIAIEPARSLVWYAAHALDKGFADGSKLAAHAKAHLADRYTSVARSAVQIHGGIGYTWEHELQVYYRRSLFDHAFLGSPSLHRDRVAALAGW